jgi:site-specific DNA recombinase
MSNTSFVELLLHPDKHLPAVRPTTDKNRNAVQWALLKETAYQPRMVSGAAFLKTIYGIYGWKADCKYRIREIRKQNADESVYMFDVRKTEIFIPTDAMTPDNNEELLDAVRNQVYSGIKPRIATPKTVCAYPTGRVETFGSDYYRHA